MQMGIIPFHQSRTPMLALFFLAVGASRVVLANLANLPLQCKPGHRPIAAAVLECFASSRVTVRKCKVVVVPGRASSKAGLDCRVMHAQGFLQGGCPRGSLDKQLWPLCCAMQCRVLQRA